MAHKFVGRPTARMEGPDKVTGAARYAADYVLPGMAWGRILRSPYAHARIKRIDATKARAVQSPRPSHTASTMAAASRGEWRRSSRRLSSGSAHEPR